MFIIRIVRSSIFVVVLATFLVVAGLPCASAVVEYGLGMVSETITGRNSAGPYFLAYTQIQEKTLEISVNGAMLRNGNDYKVDLTKGILTFKRILISDAVAKVTYKITSGKSVKTAGLLSVPLEMNVLDTGSNKLRLIGGYTATAATGTEGNAVIGLGSDSTVGTGKVSALLLTGKAAEGSPMPAGTSWTDKSLYKVGAQTSANGLSFSGNVLRAGKSFVGAKQYGVTAGRESKDATIAYTYGKLADFSMIYQNLDETAKGTTSTVQKQSLTVRPGDTTTVAITHGQNVTGTAGNDNTVETTGFKVDQKLGTVGNAVASREEITTTNGSTTSSVAVTHVAASGGTKTVQVSGSVEQKDFSNKDSESNVNLNATAKPTENIGVNMGYAQTQNDQVGNQTTTNVNLAVKEGSLIQVNAAASQSDSTKLGGVTQHSVVVKSNPVNNMQISGSLSGSESQTATKSQKEFSIIGKPADYAQLTASYSIKGFNNNIDVTKVGTIELAPLSNTKFAVGYKSVESGGNITTIRDYATTATPISFLTFSGRMRQRALASGNLDTHVIDVRMAAAGSLSLEGNYRYNPENDKGEVQNQRNTGVGVRSNIGRLGLYGGFSQKDQYKLSRSAEERTFTMDYKLDSYSSLNAGLLQTRLKDGSETGNDTYNMGFQRKVGSGFDLLLSGRYIKYLQNASMIDDDVRAEASLSMGF